MNIKLVTYDLGVKKVKLWQYEDDTNSTKTLTDVQLVRMLLNRIK